MTALDAAFAFPQMDHFAMLVAQHLKLDVPGMLEKFLCVHIRRAKSLLRLTTSCLVGGQQFILLAHNPHAPASASRRSFDNQRIPDVCRFLRELLFPFNDAVAPGNGGQTRRLYVPARGPSLPSFR